MIIPAVVAALVLGIAFDETSLTTKPYYIFDSAAINNSLVSIRNPSTRSQYRLIESSWESGDFLSVGGELSLKARCGWEGALQGIGKYLAQPVNRKRTVELLCTVYHETVAETFPSYASQREEWRSKRPEQVGTHYIRSVVYGGQLVISYRLLAEREEDVEEIKAAVDAAVAKSGSFDARVAGNLEMMSRKLGSKCKVEISAYATTGVFSPPTTLEAVLALIRDYPDMVKRVNNGKGAPVRVDLAPLASLDPRFAVHATLGGSDSLHYEAINKLEDLRVADKEFRDWEKTKFWNEEQQAQIDAYFVRLRTALSSMKHAISSLDSGVSHFEQAFRDYGEGPDNIPSRYTRELSNLTHHMENIPFYWFPYTTATTHYIHWGSVNCSLPSPEPVYVGYAATSPKGFGSGATVLCLDIEPQFESAAPHDSAPTARLTGLTYQTPGGATGFAYCAFCRLENATAVEVVAGRTSCPGDMKLEYDGFLATNRISNSGPVCMAGQPDDAMVDLHARPDPSAGRLAPLWVKCEECEGEEEWEKGRFVPCAVCSR